MTASVEVDWTAVTKGVAQLVDGIESGSLSAAGAEAARTADQIRARLPVRTGALAASVGVVVEAAGAGVTYGAGLRYARIVAARTGAVGDAVAAGERRFPPAERVVAEQEVSRL